MLTLFLITPPGGALEAEKAQDDAPPDAMRAVESAGPIGVIAGGRYPRLSRAASDSDALTRSLLSDPPQDSQYPASIVELTIDSHGERLPAHIYLAAGAGPHPTVVLLHGFPGNERNLDLAQVLRRVGFNTLFFHYRGAWGATGSYRIAHLVEDTLAVLAYLREDDHAGALRVDRGALSVLGHSLGGYTALASGAADEGLQCVMALSPANPGLWKAGLAAESGDVAERLLPYADSLFMLNDFSAASLREELQSLPDEVIDTTLMAPGLAGKTVLLLVGAQDGVTPVETMFNPVVDAYRAHKSLRFEAGVISGDHSYSGSRMTLTHTLVPWAMAHCRS